MATFSAKRLSDKTLDSYRKTIEAGADLSERQKKNLLSHLRLLATFEGDRSELLHGHNDYIAMPAWAKEQLAKRGGDAAVPWTVRALARTIPVPVSLEDAPPARSVSFRPAQTGEAD